MNTFEYRHDNQVRPEFVNGHYELGESRHIVVDDHDILYRLGSALLDNSCCGSFGCAYALVIGEPLAVATNQGATVVREIRAEEPLAQRIRSTLLDREAISVVNFYVPPLPTASGAGT